MNNLKNKFPCNVNKSYEICFSNLKGSFDLNNAFGPRMMQFIYKDTFLLILQLCSILFFKFILYSFIRIILIFLCMI